MVFYIAWFMRPEPISAIILGADEKLSWYSELRDVIGNTQNQYVSIPYSAPKRECLVNQSS